MGKSFRSRCASPPLRAKGLGLAPALRLCWLRPRAQLGPAIRRRVLLRAGKASRGTARRCVAVRRPRAHVVRGLVQSGVRAGEDRRRKRSQTEGEDGGRNPRLRPSPHSTPAFRLKGSTPLSLRSTRRLLPRHRSSDATTPPASRGENDSPPRGEGLRNGPALLTRRGEVAVPKRTRVKRRRRRALDAEERASFVAMSVRRALESRSVASVGHLKWRPDRLKSSRPASSMPGRLRDNTRPGGRLRPPRLGVALRPRGPMRGRAISPTRSESLFKQTKQTNKES